MKIEGWSETNFIMSTAIKIQFSCIYKKINETEESKHKSEYIWNFSL